MGTIIMHYGDIYRAKLFWALWRHTWQWPNILLAITFTLHINCISTAVFTFATASNSHYRSLVKKCQKITF